MKKPNAKKTNPATGSPLRKRLQGGPWVAAAVHEQFCEWQAQGISVGAIIDRLSAHACLTGFDPVTLERGAPNQQPSPTSPVAQPRTDLRGRNLRRVNAPRITTDLPQA